MANIPTKASTDDKSVEMTINRDLRAIIFVLHD
jgi:hypothetical protein